MSTKFNLPGPLGGLYTGETPVGTPAAPWPPKLCAVPAMGLSLLGNGLGSDVIGNDDGGKVFCAEPTGGLTGRSFKLKPFSNTKCLGSFA